MAQLPAHIQQGADVNSYDENGLTLLMYNDLPFDIIKYLLDHGASVNTRDKDGNTPFLLAVKNIRSIDIIQEMLKYDPDILVCNSLGKTIFSFYGRDSVKALLANHFKQTITLLQDSMSPHQNSFEPYLNELETIKEKKTPATEDVIQIHAIKDHFNTFLQQ